MKIIKIFSIAICSLSLVAVSIAYIEAPPKKAMEMQGLKNNDRGFAVVELFTSEGCSSCPPADELISSIQKENRSKQIYVLAYHVDYWNHLGWKDRFSDAAYSRRQRKYADWLNLSSVYTPQVVVNGKTEFVGSDRQALTNAINTGLQDSSFKYMKIKSRLENGQVIVEYQTSETTKKSELVIALIQKSGKSTVNAGENSGHTLRHVQIVRKLLIEHLHKTSGKVNLALPGDYQGNEWELIAFIQNMDKGEIRSAAQAQITNNK